MTDFVARQTGLPRDEAFALQKRYLHEHGTTLAGLMADHGVDPGVFLSEVHDVPMDSLVPDPALRTALLTLPGRRLVFTNGDEPHAIKVLAKLNLDDLFEDTFHIGLADYIPKPSLKTFALMMARHDIRPERTVFFEDSPRNLPPAFDLGMTTVLVGAQAPQTDYPFVHFKTDNLAAFLAAAHVQEPLP
jgi:putative hydrolase of the HAD superfamily